MNNLLNIASVQLPNMDDMHLLILAYALVVSVIEGISKTKEFIRYWRTRHLRKIWGIQNGDHVIVVCSELDDATARQHVEPREFIYNLKYGDVDAYFEVIITLLRLFPDIKLRILSAGEAENTRIDLARHLILIGGPDYNSFAAMVLKKQITQYQYRSPYVDEPSELNPEEIVLYDTYSKREFCEHTDERDYGYFERIQNPNDPEKKILLIGGCHTIGVTGAAKVFSMTESEAGEIPHVVLSNARKLAKRISNKSSFSVLVKSERVGQTINVPIVSDDNITTLKKCRGLTKEIKRCGEKTQKKYAFCEKHKHQPLVAVLILALSFTAIVYGIVTVKRHYDVPTKTPSESAASQKHLEERIAPDRLDKTLKQKSIPQPTKERQGE